MNDEEYCNLMLTLIYQTISMLDKMIDKIKEDFLKNGGIKEQMYRAQLNTAISQISTVRKYNLQKKAAAYSTRHQ